VIRLEVTRGQLVGTAIEPNSDIVRIGRAEGNDLVVPDTHVSSEHAKIVFSADRYVLVDQRSTNGTAILRGVAENGADPVRIALDDTNNREATLEDGDVIELGSQDRLVHVAVSMREDADDARVFAMKKIEELVPRATILEKDEGRLRILYEALKRIGGAQDLSEVLVAICESSFTLVPLATHVTIILRDDDEDSAAARGASGYVPVMTRVRGQDAPRSQAIPITRSVFRKVVSERAAVVAADAPRDVGQSESLMGAQIRSTLGIPLWKGDEILGVIQVDNREATGVLTASDLDIMAVLAQNASLAVANARVAKRLRAAEDRLKKENAFLKGKEQERRTGGKKDGAPEIIGNSTPMKQLLQQLEKVVNTRVTVLIEGETGVGKELVAASVHYRSNRRERLFVGQNCAAMPETLLESELFGHKKGAFTGAHEDKRGLFEVADGGTLFLDEVTEMPLSLQSKLLRVLQEGEIRPIGATQEKKVNVRIVAATNRNLEKEVAEGRFREDLYYRLKVFPLRVPPLRERREDIPLLVSRFVDKHAADRKVKVTRAAMDRLAAFPWPGNVRQLENEVRRALVLADDRIDAAELSDEVARGGPSAARDAGLGLKARVDALEAQLVRDALQKTSGNQTRAAEVLGVSRFGLQKMMRRLGIKVNV